MDSPHTPRQAATETRAQKTERVFFFGLVFLATCLCTLIVWPLVMPLFWAVVVAILLAPLYRALLRRIKNQSLASLSTLIFLLVIIVLPLYILGVIVAHDAVNLYQTTTVGQQSFLTDMFARAPQLFSALESFGVSAEQARSHLAEATQTMSTWVFQNAAGLTTATFGFVIHLVILLYLAFFLLKDGHRVRDSIIKTIPMEHARTQALMTRFAVTVRAIIKGSIVVSAIQGILGGLLFWAVGIPDATVWGVVMGILALLPLGGPTLIWLPAAIILFAMGNVFGAVVLFVGGTFLIGTIDNILRPLLVGRDTAMPDAVVLISVIGGLSVFGAGGVVIGPVIAALFLTLWEMFRDVHAKL